MLQPLVRRLQLNEDERQTVDEADQIGAAFVDLAGDPELRGEEEVVAVGVIPVNDAHGLDRLVAVVRMPAHLDAVAQQVVDLAVRRHWAERAAVAAQLRDGQSQRRGRQVGIEPRQRRGQPRAQHHLGRGLAAQVGAIRPRGGRGDRAVNIAENLIEAVGGLPAQLPEKGDGGTFDQGVF